MITKFKEYNIGDWFLDTDSIFLIKDIELIKSKGGKSEKHYVLTPDISINKKDGKVSLFNQNLYVPKLDNKYFLSTQEAYSMFPEAFKKLYYNICRVIDMTLKLSHTHNKVYIERVKSLKDKLENECDEINMISQVNKYNM